MIPEAGKHKPRRKDIGAQRKHKVRKAVTHGTLQYLVFYIFLWSFYAII